MRRVRALLLLLLLACADALRALACMHAAPGRIPPRRIPGPVMHASPGRVPPRRIPGPVPKRIYVDGNNLMNQCAHPVPAH